MGLPGFVDRIDASRRAPLRAFFQFDPPESPPEWALLIHPELSRSQLEAVVERIRGFFA